MSQPTTDAAPNQAPNRAARRAAAKVTARKATAARKPTAARKATAAKKTAAKPAKPAEKTTAVVPFHGRNMKVLRPTPEQLGVWQLYIDRLSDTNLTEERAVSLFARLIGLSQSILVDEADRLWVEDQLLTQGLSYEDIVKLMILCMEQFGQTSPAPATRAHRG